MFCIQAAMEADNRGRCPEGKGKMTAINDDLWQNDPIVVFLIGFISTLPQYDKLTPEEVWGVMKDGFIQAQRESEAESED